MASDKGVSVKILETLKADFTSEKKNLLAQNVCSRHDPLDVCLKRCTSGGNSHVFNCKVCVVVDIMTMTLYSQAFITID